MQILSQIALDGQSYHVMVLPSDCRLNPPDDRPERLISQEAFDKLGLTDSDAAGVILQGERCNLWSVEKERFEACAS